MRYRDATKLKGSLLTHATRFAGHGPETMPVSACVCVCVTEVCLDGLLGPDSCASWDYLGMSQFCLEPGMTSGVLVAFFTSR